MKTVLPFDWTNPKEVWFLADSNFKGERFGASAIKYVGADKPEDCLNCGDCFGIIFKIREDEYEDTPIAFYKCEGSADAIDFVSETEADYDSLGEESFLNRVGYLKTMDPNKNAI